MDMKIQNKKDVIPAEAGIQQVESYIPQKSLDSRFRGNDDYVGQNRSLDGAKRNPGFLNNLARAPES